MYRNNKYLSFELLNYINFHFHTFPFIFKYSFTSGRMDIHTLLYFSFVLQTFIFKNGNVFKVNIESLQDERKL